MILITGGLGFIGSHTARALLDLGEPCVLVQRRAAVVPDAFAGEAGRRLFVEQADLADPAALREIGMRHQITGIVHLAGSVPWPPGAHEPVDGAQQAVDSLLNVFRAARDWQVARLGIASTIGVYGGVATAGPVGEDVPLSMAAGPAIPAFKKIGELLTDYLADALDLSVVSYRISAAWGPLGRPASSFIAAPQLVHAAARGTAPDFAALRAPAYAGDAADLCYVKDCGRAIALLQLAGQLSHRTYNVGGGRATTNSELIAAIKKAVPGARLELPEGDGSGPAGRDIYLDITRLRQDTGYQPAYDTERAVADYIGWLRAGHDR
jgi:UDP-glucose 4-epimerase